MAVRSSEANWNGNLTSGNGTMKVGAGAYNGAYSFQSRFEEGEGTNPEELIGAALAGCYSMALAHSLAQAGHNPERVHTKADVHLKKGSDGFSIPQIDLHVSASVPGIDSDDFKQHAEQTKKNCPVSKLLTGAEIKVDASLES